MHNNILIASFFPTIDLIFLLKTWDKDGIGITKIPCYSHFSTTREDLTTYNPVPLLKDMGVLFY
jgi:hypothetical protein